MKILFVHEYLGAWGGAETNLIEVAAALRQRGHELALVHGAATGKGEEAWLDVFPRRFPATDNGAVQTALREFQPAVVYLHNSPGLVHTAGLVEGGVPVVRMVSK